MCKTRVVTELLSEKDLAEIREKLQFYDTYDAKIKKFIPVEPGKVKMYVCGPTVYDKTHIGHARTFIFFDALRRYFEILGFEVRKVVNITDIDDKMIKRAQEEGISVQEVAEKYSRYFFKYMNWLRVKEDYINPRATLHIQEILEIIKGLLEKGYAYIIDDGIYFHVPKFERYGKLSKQNLDEIVKVHRIEPNPNKKHPADFALWKFRKPGEPYWYSPWGEGRPGWHIECTAMVLKYLGKRVDIHGGGLDLVFPHHEDEIAQTEAYTGIHPWVNFWMHVGLVMVKGEKMSKSLKNIIALDEFEKKGYPPELLRFYVLKVHYRKPLDFSWEKLDELRNTWEKIVKTRDELLIKLFNGDYKEKSKFVEEIKEIIKEFLLKLADDFNTPEAYAKIMELQKLLANNMDNLGKKDIEKALAAFRVIDETLAILPEPKIKEREMKLIQLIVEIRNLLRKEKRYDISDKIREKLAELGIELHDYRDRTKWLIKY